MNSLGQGRSSEVGPSKSECPVSRETTQRPSRSSKYDRVRENPSMRNLSFDAAASAKRFGDLVCEFGPSIDRNAIPDK